MIYDIILVVLILLSTFIGIRRGAAKTLLSLAAIALSAILAVAFAKALSGIIFESFVRVPLEKEVSKAIANFTFDPSKSGNFENPLSAMFLGGMAYFGISYENMQQTCTELIDTKGSDAAGEIVSLYKPVVTGFISVILTIILFIILVIILTLLAKVVAKAFKLPLVNFANTLAGGVLGLVRGVVTVVALAILLNLLAPVIPSDTFFFGSESVSRSSIFAFIYNGGLTAAVQSFVYSFS